MNLLIRLEDMPDGGAVVVKVASGRSVILARKGETVFAYENRCDHAESPLEHDGGHVLVQERRYLVCAMHGARYDMTNGACAGGPCSGGLAPIAIEIVEGAVLIR